MSRLRVGVIGLGAIAQIHHLSNLEQLGDLYALDHICDLSAQTVDVIGARYPAARRSTDWREVCSDPQLDAVLLLHSGGHGQQTRMALEHGLHVFAEKPLCYTRREARELGELARERRLALQVGYMKSHESVMDEARRQVDALGELRLVRHAVWHPSETAQQAHLGISRFGDGDPIQIAALKAHDQESVCEAIGSAPAGIAWLYEQLALGSIVHYLAVFRSLFGRLPDDIEDVRAWPFSSSEAPRGWTSDDQLPTLSVRAAFDPDFRLELTWAWLQRYPRYLETVEVLSPSGGVTLHLPPPYLRDATARLEVDRLHDGLPVTTSVHGGYEVAFARELRAFHHESTSGSPSSVGSEQAAADAGWCQAMVFALAASEGIPLAGEAGGLTPS